jgi:predicted amidohydrolase YtcJ
VSPEQTSLDAFFAKGIRVGGGSDLLSVRAIKAYADGALGSRGAALLAD